MTTIAGPVVAKRPGEKWSGVCVPSLVFLPLPLRPQHNWAPFNPATGPTNLTTFEEEHYAPARR